MSYLLQQVYSSFIHTQSEQTLIGSANIAMAGQANATVEEYVYIRFISQNSDNKITASGAVRKYVIIYLDVANRWLEPIKQSPTHPQLPSVNHNFGYSKEILKGNVKN